MGITGSGDEESVFNDIVQMGNLDPAMVSKSIARMGTE